MHFLRSAFLLSCLLGLALPQAQAQYRAALTADSAASISTAPPPSTNGSAMLVVRLGHVAPTTGVIAHLGKDNELGARLAVEELNARGVEIGGQRAQFELVAEDDAADPRRGVAAAQRLVGAGVNGVIGHLNSGTSIPASRIYSEAGIPQITPSATNPRFTRSGYKTTFRVLADDAQLGSILGRYAVERVRSQSFAVIDDRTGYGQGVADAFVKGVRDAGGEVVAREFTNDKAVDFSAPLLLIKAQSPDVIFFGGMDTTAGPLLRQMRQLGINAKFMGGDGICTGQLPKLASGAMSDGQVVCAEAGGVDGDDRQALNDFRARFKARFNTDVQIFAPYAYDAVNVLVAAMVRAGSADPARYLPELAATSGYPGVTGPITFDDKGDISGGAATLYTYRGGRREQLDVVR